MLCKLISFLHKTVSMRKTKVNINNERLQESSEILRALAHPLRMKILEFIDKHKTINVNKIYNTLKTRTIHHFSTPKNPSDSWYRRDQTKWQVYPLQY